MEHSTDTAAGQGKFSQTENPLRIVRDGINAIFDREFAKSCQPAPRPRPFAEMITRIDSAHDALLGHLEAGETKRAVDALETHIVKLRAAMASLCAFVPEVEMVGEWEAFKVESYFLAYPDAIEPGTAPALAIDVTSCGLVPLVERGRFKRMQKDFTATLLDWHMLRDGRVVARYEVDVW
jgi:hypothetical protein